MLEIFQMPHEIDTMAGHLSGGSKRKLNLMIAFAGTAQVLLLDEPTSGVDSDARRVMWDLINEQKKDKLILFTTHQMNEADILCDQIAIMCHGRILVQDSYVGLKKDYGVGYKIVLPLPIKQKELVEELAAKIDEQSFVDVNGNLVVCKVSDEKFLVPMLQMLEEKFPQCKISTKCSSLNEVFLKLAHENEIDKKSTQEQAIVEQKLQQMASTIHERPTAFYQLLYMFMKRFWYSVIYYGPLALLLLACVLGFIVQFGVSRIIVIQGNNGTYSLSNSFSTEMLYTQNDDLFQCKLRATNYLISFYFHNLLSKHLD
jgi:energy-coupling factor transporter ATP-binding protein EcfA2